MGRKNEKKRRGRGKRCAQKKRIIPRAAPRKKKYENTTSMIHPTGVERTDVHDWLQVQTGDFDNAKRAAAMLAPQKQQHHDH